MNNLINITQQEGQFVVSSREVAENFEKEHYNVLKAIRGYERNGEHVNGLVDQVELTADYRVNARQYFIPNTYTDASGKTNEEYLLTRDGFSLLVMGFTGSKAMKWKLKYIDAFNAMEEQLKQKNSPQNLPQTYLEALKALVASEEEKQALQIENSHQKNVIEGLTEDISLAEKRRRISDIVRYGGKGKYQERFRLLYKEFEMKHHIDLNRRMKNYEESGKKPKIKSKMDYIDKELNMIPELYDVACKLFENDFAAYLRELEFTIDRDK